MKHLILTVIFCFSLTSQSLYSQRIIFQSDFENINFPNSDSLPAGWKKIDADSNFFGLGKSWAVRDTNQILGGDTTVNKPRSHSGKKSLHISWFSGKGGSYVSDDWVWTDSFTVVSGDSLIFWSLLGNTKGITHYTDSLQIWICASQNVFDTINKITTLKSNLDTLDNFWIEHKFNLSQYAGQIIYIAFRYYLPVQNALWCNIDDMLIGNRSSVGIAINQFGIPESFRLFQNFPNPFNSETVIRFDIPQRDFVRLNIYDINGKLLKSFINIFLNAGSYDFRFDSESQSLQLGSGVYFYSLETREYAQSKKFILIK
ncbi:MAG: hypothetical protein HGGPFJEG_01782 [Ignavibacteria bacterium]|nr:hypothetical protein [Ignavibacteria bacterium]